MGHHHRKNRNEAPSSTPENNNSNNTSNNNPLGNIDLSSILGNFNLDNIDFSKIDFNKVQSAMKNMKLPENGNTGNGEHTSSYSDPRISFLNSLKGLLPPGRSKTMDNITKFIQLTSMVNNVRNPRS